MTHTQAQRTAAALLAAGARLDILAPRDPAELARLDRIADGPPSRPARPTPAPSSPLWPDMPADYSLHRTEPNP
jgi:hypothetical protein